MPFKKCDIVLVVIQVLYIDIMHLFCDLLLQIRNSTLSTSGIQLKSNPRLTKHVTVYLKQT